MSAILYQTKSRNTSTGRNMAQGRSMAHKALVKPVGTNPGWKSISDAVLRLFTLKRYPELATNLSTLNEKVSAISKSELGQFIGDYYHDHLLSQCMEKLRQEVVKERNEALVDKMAGLWVQFYTSILPTLLAIFASVQPQQNKLSIRSLSLISFRDYVVLETKLAAAIQRHEGALPPQIQQMLLVLQSVHQSPPDDKFFILQDMVSQVVERYQPMVTRSNSFKKNPLQEELARSNRAGTIDILDGGSTSQGKRNSHVRTHSLGQVDLEGSGDHEPVTRL